MPAQLRVYRGAAEKSSDDVQQPSVRVSLSELLPIIAVAKRHNYLWLQDFLDDEVRITPDLYDVLRAFNSYRPSA